MYFSTKSRRPLGASCLGGRGHNVSSLVFTWTAVQLTRSAEPELLYENSMTKPADCGNWYSRPRTAIWLQYISFVAVSLTSLPISAVHWMLLSSYTRYSA